MARPLVYVRVRLGRVRLNFISDKTRLAVPTTTRATSAYTENEKANESRGSPGRAAECGGGNESVTRERGSLGGIRARIVSSTEIDGGERERKKKGDKK